MKLLIRCDWCGREFTRDTSALKGKKHHFCCRKCLADFSNKSKNPKKYSDLKDSTNASKHMSELNRQLNPTRMSKEIRAKLRKAHLNSGKGKTYSKFYGKPEHRVVAEAMLGRSLLPGEVVHHIDGNKRNNAANNLRVFSSQAEHVKFHAECDWFLKEIERLENEEGGDAK